MLHLGFFFGCRAFVIRLVRPFPFSLMQLHNTLLWYSNVFDTLYRTTGGAEVAGWTLDRKIWVRFPAYPHRVWALWWQGGKRRLRTSRCPCRGRLGTLKTPSCPLRGCPAAGQHLETGHLSRHYIAEISLNVTLNHNQQSRTTGRHFWPELYNSTLSMYSSYNINKDFY